MTFDKLKPGMFLIPPPNIGSKAWTIIKRKQGSTVTVADYWVGATGHFYITYNRVKQKSVWDGGLRGLSKLAATKDAQNLIVTMFEKA